MGWEWRNGRRYYYLKQRVDGQVVSRYLGSYGVLGESVRQEQAAELLAERSERKLQLETDHKLDETCRKLQRARHNLLRAAGFHQHKGQWRKKRTMSKRKQASPPAETQALAKYSPAELLLIKGISLDLSEGKAPHSAQQEYRELIRQNPAEIARLGDLVKHATWSLIQSAWDHEVATRICVEEQVALMKQEHGYDNAPLLERMAIDEMALAWIRLYDVQTRHTRRLYHQNGVRSDTAEYWDRRLMYSQRRFLRACESLARIRKLSRGVKYLQVNIAQAGAQQAKLLARPEQHG
jgi:hypothetical protein